MGKLMRCVHIDNPGPASQLVIASEPIPTPKHCELLVRVHCAGVNHADLYQRQGKYPPPLGASPIPGLEVAGEVVAVGAGVSQFNLGDRVYGLVSGGGYAEFCCVHERLVQRIPEGISFEEAAAIPEAITTAYATLFQLGRLKSGQTLLIHGAGSGISSLAIQMAKEIGARVITTIGSESKRAKAEALGADSVINHRQMDFSEAIPKDSVDVIVDFVGGEYFPRHLLLLVPHGHLIEIATLAGSRVTYNLAPLIRKCLHISGFVLRSQPNRKKWHLWRTLHKHWYTPLSKREIKPMLDTAFALNQVDKAHAYMSSSQHFGKLIVVI